MKFLSLVTALVLASVLPLAAQVTVDVKLDQEQFLPGESLPVTVRIINRSGQAIKLGNDPDWLTFSVEASDSFIVIKNSEVPVLGEFTVGSSQMATKHVDLAPHFVLTQQGRYRVQATVHLKDWETQVVSAPANFDVIEGAKLWSREFGVPLAAGASNQAPEVRKYTLEQANYLRSQLRLYFRLTDASESKVFRVFAVGPMVSFGQPEAQLDKLSNVHILYQTGARSFNYTSVSTDGTILARQTYDYTSTRPRLQLNDQGNFVIAGGQRHVTSTDIPPPIVPSPAADTSSRATEPAK